VIDKLKVMGLLVRALEEDIGTGDITTNSCVPADAMADGAFFARDELVVAGTELLALIYDLQGGITSLEIHTPDGSRLQSGDKVASVRGRARTLLTCERVCLNFLQRLSGVATMAARYADAVKGTRTRILDTRKTTPGWRRLEKDAVRAGGGVNHRFSLGDGILVKDNHVAACGGVAEAVRRARARGSAMLKVEVEVVDLAGLDEAIAAGADIVLLDNMDDAALSEAVRRAKGRVLLEASGNMTQERLPRVAATGVDFVSMGAITHSARAVDISFELG